MMSAIKFKDFSFRNNVIKYALISVSLLLLVFLQWLAIPVIFVLYLVLSMFSKVPPPVVKRTDSSSLDVTV